MFAFMECVYFPKLSILTWILFWQLRCLKGQRGFSSQPPFDGIHIVNHLIGDDESFHSSDEEFIDNSLQESGIGFPLHRKSGPMSLDPTMADGSESEAEDSALGTREGSQVAQKEQPLRRASYSTTVWPSLWPRLWIFFKGSVIMTKGFWNISVSYVYVCVYIYKYIFYSLICLFIFAKSSPLTHHCHKVEWNMVNGKNEVLTVLLNINISCLENAIISICGEPFWSSELWKIEFSSDRAVVVQYFMLSEQIVYLHLSICFQRSCLHTFNQGIHLSYLGILCLETSFFFFN